MPEQDYWDSPTESGLPDNFTITISPESFFAPSAKRGGGEVTMLNIVGTGIGDDGSEYQFTTNEPMLLSTGKTSGWKSLDGGKSVSHPDGKIKFNENSDVGVWVKRIAVDLGGRDVLRARGLTPLQAEFWHGMTLHVVRETVTARRRNPAPGEEETFTYERVVPDRFDGYQVAGAQAPAATTTTTVTNPSPTPADLLAEAKAKVAAAKAASANGAGSLEEKVRAMAAEHADYASYEAAVLTLDGITDDDTLLAKALDQSETGIFAEVKKG